VCDAVSDAAAMGYEVVSVSGGEPLMYGGLDEVLCHAKSLGMKTTVTTNGYFTRNQRLDRMRNLVDVLAISLDGPPEIHNRIRGSARAFERLAAGLEQVREAGLPFGIIHTLTSHNWEHLLWVADFAAQQGARLFQIHPIELTGRARSHMAEAAPDEDVLAKVYVLACVLASKYAGVMSVHSDLLYRDHLIEEPALVYADEPESELEGVAPARLVGLLVLEDDGTIVPTSYGFSRRYQLCNVKERRLAEAWPEYVVQGYSAFKDLCRRVYHELCAPEAPLLFNWHELVAARSHWQQGRNELTGSVMARSSM
jgi:MoaA/NifB/PqqE/SkfB family radical SAM enzyme